MDNSLLKILVIANRVKSIGDILNIFYMDQE